MSKWLAVISIATLIGGCADSQHLIKGDTTLASKLTSSDAVYVALPKDGSYDTKPYQGSGQITAQIIYSAFAKHAHSIEVGNSAQTFNEALNSARNSGQKYLVYPVILHWEDRATEWSMIPDRVEVKIEVMDTTSKASLASGVIKGKSGLATFGGDHPQDLLPEPIEEFVSSLY